MTRVLSCLFTGEIAGWLDKKDLAFNSLVTKLLVVLAVVEGNSSDEEVLEYLDMDYLIDQDKLERHARIGGFVNILSYKINLIDLIKVAYTNS